MNNLEALKTIKEECIKQFSCEECPFGDENDICKIEEYYPRHWKLKEKEENTKCFK